jgi:hypothetical protein
MISIIAISTMILVTLVIGLVMLLRNLGSAHRSLPVTAEWIDELSLERYRPMMRLLDSRDIEFLRSQPGYTSKMESRLRAQRCQLFRGYVRCLDLDFQRVCMTLKLLMVQSQQDRPDLAAVLVHQQFLFASGLLVVQGRLLLYRWGVCNVDATSLVQVFDCVRLELRHLVPAAMPVCA